ncbi:MAG: hypothetical protein ABIJ28_01570 [Patescibacteria group bacterium]|nr:pilin [Patescibacteria group bacterium]
MKYKPKIILLSTFYFLLTASLAGAAGLVPCNGVDCTICDLAKGIEGLIDFILLNIVFPLAIIAFLYGGIKMITAGGSDQSITQGKKAVTMAFWGILIAFGAWLIIDLIMRGLVSGEFSWTWNEFPGCN